VNSSSALSAAHCLIPAMVERLHQLYCVFSGFGLSIRFTQCLETPFDGSSKRQVFLYKKTAALRKRQLIQRQGKSALPLPLRVNYLSSTVAPAASSLALSSSASAFGAPSLTALGALSTSSFASFRPRPVIARTSLITLIFLSPAEASTTSNSVFSSAASPPPPAAAATATGAAAETPHSSSRRFERSAASITVKLESCSIILSN